ncbi:hypothetical protein ACKLNR_014535 [Fusarium oxysporum f. sp. zingiberi]
MAILPAVPHISITVLIDGMPAREYQPSCLPQPIYLDGRDKLPMARCFIESQAEKAYKIRYRVSPLFFFPHDTDILIIAIFIDGQLFDERAVLKTQLNGLDYIEEIWYRQRNLTDGSSEWYGMAFKKVTMEEADQKTTEADLQRIKTLGTIEVVVRVAKGAAHRPTAPSLDDGKRNESLAFSQKALVLNYHEKGHGTSYRKIDDNCALDSRPLPVQNIKSLGQFLFFYRSHDFLKARNILDPRFVNHDAHGMRHPTQDNRVSIMSNGRTLIDLTGDP